ncbi:hypothetical protein [Treponema zioleckii]|uniref:hypothetical protein n=1 Tax=Treponema zioleckii TaxID=331680 RepID=UPI00168BED23|nr:hypothetical protein [Treponema zioleckii]
MKKIITILSALVLGTAVFADGSEKNYDSFIGAGLSGVFSNYKVDDDGSRKNIGGGFDLSLLTVNKENGFSLKADFGAGIVTTEDFPNMGRETGLYTVLNAGAGYSFLHTEDTIFSVFGMCSIGRNLFNDDSNIPAFSDMSFKQLTYGIGADVTFMKRVGSQVYLFANVGARFEMGTESVTYSNEKNNVSSYSGTTRDILGNVSVTPTIGVSYKL